VVSVWFWDGLEIVKWFGDGLRVVGVGWGWFGAGLALVWGSGGRAMGRRNLGNNPGRATKPLASCIDKNRFC
jgi:hypothetical protein